VQQGILPPQNDNTIKGTNGLKSLNDRKRNNNVTTGHGPGGPTDYDTLTGLLREHDYRDDSRRGYQLTNGPSLQY